MAASLLYTNLFCILKSFIILDYKELKEFIANYKIKPDYTNQYLLGVAYNANLKTDEKIEILDKYSEIELDTKNMYGGGLIFAPIKLDDMKLFDYLLSRHVSVDYYTFMLTEEPLREALYTDILNNQYKYSKKILDYIKQSSKEPKEQNLLLTSYDKYIDTILHSICYIRINRNKQIINPTENINYEPDHMIMDIATNDDWNQHNIEKLTPLDLITYLDFSTYHGIIKKNNISVDSDIITRLKGNLEKSKPLKEWYEFYKTLPTYHRPKESIKLDNTTYSSATLFQAKFKDVGIFTLYLADKYKDMLIPNMETYLLDDMTFEDTFPFSDNVIAKKPVFPWTICYYNENEYYIHPYLNNIINATRREGTKRFAMVFLSIIFDKTLHANVLIYDFKNMTLERFEPYGNSNVVDSNLDDTLEEELTWSTGLTYIRPGDFLPVAGFQTISDENNDMNKKQGDFGGFCLAWCLWYVENRLKNPEIKPKDLVSKLFNILNNADLKFSEHIRNYSNKINEKRVSYLEKIGINHKEISNIHLSHESDNMLTKYLINRFSSRLN